MILYHSGHFFCSNSAYNTARYYAQTRALASYHYYRRVFPGEPPPEPNGTCSGPGVALDSGAFSAWTLGVELRLEEYADFLIRYGHLYDWYANLDVIGDADATRRNQETLEAMGLTPVPVFHHGEPWAVLEELCERYEFLALGGMVGKCKQPDELRVWLDGCFHVVKRYWPRRIHAFGMTSERFLLRYPFYSADSSRWLAGSRYGHVYDRRGRLGSRLLQLKYADRPDEKRYVERCVHNIEQLDRRAEFITMVWKRRGIDWEVSGEQGRVRQEATQNRAHRGRHREHLEPEDQRHA